MYLQNLPAGQLLIEYFLQVRVCEDEDKDDDDAKNELQELRNIPSHSHQPSSLKKMETSDISSSILRATSSRPLDLPKPSLQSTQQSSSTKNKDILRNREAGIEASRVTTIVKDETNKLTNSQSSIPDGSCPVCSVVNERAALTCMICSNVLKPNFVPGSWRCKSSTCKGSEYVNAGDAGLCGVCGARKCS